MKDAVLAQFGHAAWQTPRNGDFARYVEQLTGGQATVTLDEPGRVPRLAERTAKASASPGNPVRIRAQAPSAPREADAARSEFATIGGSASQALGAVRWGFLLFAVVQVVLLMVLSLGSVFGVGASLVIWWLLGRVKRLVEGVGKGGVSQGAVLAQVRRELQQRAANQPALERRA